MPDEKDPTKESSAENDQSDDIAALEGIPVSPQDVPQELLDKILPEAQRELRMFLSATQRIGFAPNPIAGKITSEHITQVIGNAESDSQRIYKSQWFSLGYAVLALAFLVFVFIYLPTVDKELFVEVLKLLLTFLGGLGAGFGIAKYKGKK